MHHLSNADWSIALVIPRHELEKSLTFLNLFASIFGGLLIATTVGMLRYLKLLRRSRENAEALRQANERSRFESNQRLQTQAALIERMSLAALSADIGIALTQGMTWRNFPPLCRSVGQPSRCGVCASVDSEYA
jgi:hypothetical protein